MTTWLVYTVYFALLSVLLKCTVTIDYVLVHMCTARLVFCSMLYNTQFVTLVVLAHDSFSCSPDLICLLALLIFFCAWLVYIQPLSHHLCCNDVARWWFQDDAPLPPSYDSHCVSQLGVSGVDNAPTSVQYWSTGSFMPMQWRDWITSTAGRSTVKYSIVRHQCVWFNESPDKNMIRPIRERVVYC